MQFLVCFEKVAIKLYKGERVSLIMKTTTQPVAPIRIGSWEQLEAPTLIIKVKNGVGIG